MFGLFDAFTKKCLNESYDIEAIHITNKIRIRGKATNVPTQKAKCVRLNVLKTPSLPFPGQ